MVVQVEAVRAWKELEAYELATILQTVALHVLWSFYTWPSPFFFHREEFDGYCDGELIKVRFTKLFIQSSLSRA